MFLEAPGVEVRVTQEVEAILEVRVVIAAPEVAPEVALGVALKVALEVALEVVRELAREVVQCPATEVKVSPEVGAPAEVEVNPLRDHLAVYLQVQSDSNQINFIPSDLPVEKNATIMPSIVRN